MSLYNLRSTELGFRISKFDADMNVEASYDLREAYGEFSCTCPASHRPSCRHRVMIHRMKVHANDGWFYNYEHQNWHRPLDADAQGQDREPEPIEAEEYAPNPVERAIENAIEVEEQLAVRAINANVDNPPHIRRR